MTSQRLLKALMKVLRSDRLVLTDPGFIRDFISDLTESNCEITADAIEIASGTTVKVTKATDNHFEVSTDQDAILPSAPMASWRMIVKLDGAEICITTALLAQTDSRTFALLIPDEIVSGKGRLHYRIYTNPKEVVQVSLATSMGNFQVEVMDASFSGTRVRFHPKDEFALQIDEKVQIMGRFRGIMFQDHAVVKWVGNRVGGLEIVSQGKDDPVESKTWSHVVRRMAYENFMGRTQQSEAS